MVENWLPTGAWHVKGSRVLGLDKIVPIYDHDCDVFLEK